VDRSGGHAGAAQPQVSAHAAVGGGDELACDRRVAYDSDAVEDGSALFSGDVAAAAY
jgi:hypothetical protein